MFQSGGELFGFGVMFVAPSLSSSLEDVPPSGAAVGITPLVRTLLSPSCVSGSYDIVTLLIILQFYSASFIVRPMFHSLPSTRPSA
jgi:hypothetical protein